MKNITLGIILAFAVLSARVTAATECAAESGSRRVPLLELYTSEGCDSCPPADRWVSGLPRRGLLAEHIVTLGFHVDYWNYLGWNDPYARPEFSVRQRAASRRNQARVVYTPQLLLNGRDYRRVAFRETFADDIAALNRDRPRARIGLKTSMAPAGILAIQGSAHVPEPAERSDARVYLALYENKLASDIKAGENRGKRLQHDFVVRALAGPFPVERDGSAAFIHRLPFDSRWKPADLNVAAFVQNERTGDVLQALAMPHCGGGGRSPRGG